MSVLKVKNGNQWNIVPAIKGDPGDPAADESITDDMLVTDGIKTEIEWLWGNQLMDSREGEILHAEDAYTAPAVDISVDGKSTQVTTTGKNLLDESNNIVRGYFYDSNEKIEGGGTSIYAPVTEGATYTLSGGNGNRYVIAYTDVLPAVNAPLIAHASAQKTFTVPTGARYVVFYIDNGSTLTPSGYQLEFGSSASTYEPYTGGKPSPNPDYPQEIVSVDEPSLELRGKQLMDWANPFRTGSYNYDIAIGTVITPATNANVEVSIDGDKLVMVTKAAWIGAIWRSPDLPNGTYYMYFPTATTSDYTGTSVGTTLFVVDKDNRCVRKIDTHATTGDWHHAITLSGDEAAICVNAGTRSGAHGTNTYDKPQLELGSTATTYEPYLGNTVSLLPDEYSLRSLPDGTKDELHLSYLRPSTREGWAWYSRELVREIDKCGDGTPFYVSTIALQSDDTVSFIVVDGNLINHIKQHPISNIAILNGPITSRIAVASHIYMRFPQSVVGTTVTSIKSYLDEHCILLYHAATPTTETLDPIELPIMPSQTVNVWSDPATNLKMTYIQDSNLVIENLEATIADIATS